MDVSKAVTLRCRSRRYRLHRQCLFQLRRLHQVREWSVSVPESVLASELASGSE
jgi:hypothetical protein